jgi:nicotinate phosphoribosyltransferase
MTISALNTDFYELTMMQGYFLTNNNPQVVFDMFYRTNPYNGGYVVFAGLNELIWKLERLAFSQEDIDYLASLNKFDRKFLEYLAIFKFSGTIHAMDEGTVVFPGEPLIRVETNLMEAQLIEGLLLNTINFQSLIATKACRMRIATNNGQIMEFGLRRAQGPDGALSATRAAFIGGASATSNTLGGKIYGIPVAGTMAHSWIMSFENELDSFREFAHIYPNNCILLIDTYDTLGSGIENAIIVGKELQAQGHSMGIRIDSGDLSYLSREIRRKLDDAGLTKTRIYVSNDLTEEIIETLVHDEVPIDSWGIGTHLVTGGTQSSLNGVYKLSARQLPDGSFLPTMKISNSFEKATNPGIKQVWRFYDAENSAIGDLITLEQEEVGAGVDWTFYHPFNEADQFVLKNSRYTCCKPLLSCKVKDGLRVQDTPSLKDIQTYAFDDMATFHRSYKRMINPHIYKVSLSKELKSLKMRLTVEGREKTKKDPS